VNAGFSYLSKVPALLKMEETVLQKEGEFKKANEKMSIIIYRQEAQIDSLKQTTTELNERISSTNMVLVEELEHKDTLGSKLEMTNPGNLYKFLDKNFHKASYDYKYKKWVY